MTTLSRSSGTGGRDRLIVANDGVNALSPGVSEPPRDCLALDP
jgi:hypothetical protein